ncbi:hypothetical protein GPJ56_007743 [Histomonas meleagridis]|uniref:uncharacterized protein n=1 Tax=Histomonas meleagridis TaxID=135588 RepID=UPI00355A0757|nr:hypothetical protein GPJ56_007743 [Histomonas meleagridis]KAH0798779.1 hypothetical protein GO595_008644 [Histomonas meleagridis]
MQTLIPISLRDEKLQLIESCYGNGKQISQEYTVYQQANIIIRIDEDLTTNTDDHTIVTLGELKRAPQEGITTQHALISHVSGDAHKFIRSMGHQPTHTWIERGYSFEYESITIKIFEILSWQEVSIDPDNVAISIEGFSPIQETATKSLCNQIQSIYMNLLYGIQPFTPGNQFIRS